jgi:hypothetical protein
LKAGGLFMKKTYKIKKVLIILTALVLCVFVPHNVKGEDTNEQTVYNLLTGTYGFNGAQASGIMASIYAESRFDPTATSASGKSYGLMQWTGGRKSAFFDYCSTNNMDATGISAQLSYMYYELVHSETNAMKKLSGITDDSEGAYSAGYNFCYYYERPKAKTSASVSRATRARDVYFASYGATATASTISQPASTTTDDSQDSTATTSTSTEATTTKTTKLTAGTYKIKKTVAVRKKATTKGKVVGYIKKGQKVRVKIVKNVKWGKIKYKGRNAYVSLRYSSKVKVK